jgi:tetratricopeptide (TPR) repeat protein
MHTIESHNSFAENLGHLLKRFCPEGLLKALGDALDHIKITERELTEKAKNKEAELLVERSIVDTANLEHIITECGQGLAPREFFELLFEIGCLCLRFGEFKTAKIVFTQVIGEAGSESRFGSVVGRAYCKRAEIRLRQAQWTTAQNDLKRGAQVFKKAKNVEGLAGVENSLGIFATELGNTKQAVTHFKKAQTGFDRSGDAERSSAALMNIGIVNTIAGKWDEALAHYQRILPQFEKLGKVSRLVELHHNLGMLFLAKGDSKAALSQFDESLNHARFIQYRAFVGLAYLGKATAYARLADHPLAMVFVDKSLTIFRELNDHLSIADTYRVKGIIHRELNHPQIAELYFKTSLRLNEEYNNPLNMGETYFELGKLYKHTQQNTKAAQTLKKAVGFFKKVGAQSDARSAQTVLAAVAA